MSKVTINAVGRCDIKTPAERATARCFVSFEGPEPEPVYESVAAATESVRTSIAELKASGSVTWFAVAQVRRAAGRPWNQDGLILPVVHSATVSIMAKFRDFDALDRWLAWGVQIEGLGISRVDWTLTAKTQARVEREARTQAALDAQNRAQDFADAMGLGVVAVREIRDHGSSSGNRGLMYTESVGSLGDELPASIQLEPAHIEVSAEVSGVFKASV